MGGLQEWQQPEVHRAAVILQGHRRHLAVIDRSDVDPPALHEAVGKGEAFRRVVVAADQQHRQGPVRQLDEKIVQQRHRLRGGDVLVIDVSRDERRVRPFLIGDLQNAVQDVRLILQHREVVDPLPQVEVGQMDQFHSRYLLSARAAGRPRSEAPSAGS